MPSLPDTRRSKRPYEISRNQPKSTVPYAAMKERPLARCVALAVLVTLGCSLLTGGASAEAKPTGAHLFLSPQGSGSGKCTRAAPCRSLQRAYRVARPGQIVELAGGAYGDQQLERDPRKASGFVTFKRGLSGRPYFESLEINPGIDGVVLVGLHF